MNERPAWEDLSSLELEGDLYPNEDPEARARRIFREALPAAAQRVTSLISSPNDKISLDAAKYVVERNLGKPGEDPAHASNDLLRQLVEGFEDELRKEA